MKFKHRFKILMGLAAALFLAAGFTGCHRNKSPEEKAAYLKEKIVDKLDLDENQSKLLDDLTDYLIAWEKDSRTERDADRDFARAQITADQIDTAAVRAIYDRRRQELDSRFDLILEKVAALHKSLTPEQKKELAEYMEKFGKHRKHHG